MIETGGWGPRGIVQIPANSVIYTCATNNAQDYEVHVVSIQRPVGGQRDDQNRPLRVGSTLVSTCHYSYQIG